MPAILRSSIRVLLLALFIGLLNACTMTAIEFPPTRELASGGEHVEASSASGAPLQRLQMGEVTVHPAAPLTPANRQPLPPAIRDQIEQYLSAALIEGMGRSVWVQRRHEADYVVDVDVTVDSEARINAYFTLSVALELASFAVGTGVGTGIATAVGSHQPFLLGGLTGLLASIPLALATAFAPPATTATVTYEAHVSIRRVIDGVVVDTRRVRTSWHADVSAYSAAPISARESGIAIAQLATRIVHTLRRELDDAPVIAPAPRPWETQSAAPSPPPPTVVPEIRVTPSASGAP